MTTIEIIKSDITSVTVEAIVCPAHKHLIRGQGLSAQLFDMAGPQLIEECAALPPCKVGEARLTRAYNLPARYLIHTVTPQWSGGDQWAAQVLKQLSQCYESVIQVARSEGIRSLAFPALGAGCNKVPHSLAAHQALAVLTKYEGDFEQLLVCLHSEASEQAWQKTYQQFYPSHA